MTKPTIISTSNQAIRTEFTGSSKRTAAFNRFEDLTKKLMQVPKDELDSNR